MDSIFLSEAKAGKKYRVASLDQRDPALLRLLEMGFSLGTEIIMCDKAPFGDPIWVFIRGSYISLRISDARKIEVMPI